MRLRSRLNMDGFTMVETLVSLTVLAMFFAGLVVIFQSIINLVGESRVRVVATALASERIEEVRNMIYTDVGVVGGIPPGTLMQEEVVNINGQDFTVNTSVVFIDDPFDDVAPTDPISTDYKRVRVAVAWGGPYGSVTPVVMVTDSAPDGLETDVGGGTLIANVINAVGESVSGANVNIVNDSVNPVINLQTVSDENGRIVLPGAPECNECYQISVSRSGYSSERTYSTSEVANPLKPHAGIIEGEVTEMTFAIDVVSSLNVLVTGSRLLGYPPFQGVQFELRGNKTIGTDDQDQSVLKYEQSHVSGSGGQVTIGDLEFDSYTISIPLASSVDFAGSNPVSPFSLLPNQNLGLTIVTEAASANTLLVIAEDVSGVPVASASMLLEGPGSFVATESGGLTGQGDYGQALFSNLTGGNYDLTVSQVGFLDASASAVISGDVVEVIIMESE